LPTIAILVTDRCQASNIHTILDILIAANQVAKGYLGSGTSPFRFSLIGLKTKVQAYNQSSIDNIQLIHRVNRPDVVIIPGAFEAAIKEEEVKDCIGRYNSALRVIVKWHNQGTLLASACTGNFLLAETNLARGRPITCHWAFSSFARRLFPGESFHEHKLLIDHGDIVSAGGATAVAQLVLYLLAREHSRELAQITAKIMLIEMNFEQQSRFAIFKPSHDHQDAVVLKLQAQIEECYSESLDLSSFASNNALSEKQIVRRFKTKTGETPLSYLQKIRIEQVKLRLESSTANINKAIWDVGYEDISSFRRLFKKSTGLTLQEYRNRFSICQVKFDHLRKK
jgi:transcriptional regulator GlxA family with amidase domain